MYIEVALIAYVLDVLFGEFGFIRHPVIVMGDYISWFEKHFYADDRYRGAWLFVSSVVIFGSLAFILSLFLPMFLQGIVASMFLAHRMLHDSVKAVLTDPKPKKALSYLVSRDTQNLSKSDINKSLIETYAENLSDGVIAPLLYLLFFGLVGIVIYKTINTLDSMVGYKTHKYKHFGYVSAKADDVANFIPARLSALLIMLLGKCYCFKRMRTFAKGHASPNAGYPISAMAVVKRVSLGGPTSYHGEMVNKPYFGDGRKQIGVSDVRDVLDMAYKVDVVVIFILFAQLISLNNV